jgi:hypothetical protein
MTVRVSGEAAEIALAETQAVLAHVLDEDRRGRLADLLAAVRDGAVDGPDADALEEVLGLGLQTGRVRALYGPDGEQAALRVYRRLPGGRRLGESAREVTDALGGLAGRTLEAVRLQATGPGTWTVTVTTDTLELAVRLDPGGARLATVAV